MTSDALAIVPLLLPSPGLLRADAVWVTACNWADALAARYGGARIHAGSQCLTAAEVRSRLFVQDDERPAGPGRSPVRRLRRARLIRPLEAVAKDLRWWSAGRGAELRAIDSHVGTPYVWQHHDLFQDRGRALADRLGVPLVHFVDAPQVWEARRWDIKRLGLGGVIERFGEWPQAQSADVVACVSRDVAEAVAGQLRVDKDRIMVAPCTVDVARFSEASGDSLRSELGLSGKTVIGWVGSFRPFHAVELLVEAFALAAQRESGLHLLLVGDGPTRCAAEMQVAAKELTGGVTFLGSVPHHDVPDVIDAFDIAALPAGHGAFHYSPLKLREYAAAGTAIVACDVGDLDEVFEPEEIISVPPGSPEALGRALANLAREPSLRSVLGAAARAAAVKRFGMIPIIEELEARLR